MSRGATEADAVLGIDPAALAVAERYLLKLNVPHRRRFTLSQLATDVGGSVSGWRLECVHGAIEAAHLLGGWVVTWDDLVTYVAERHNRASLN